MPMGRWTPASIRGRTAAGIRLRWKRRGRGWPGGRSICSAWRGAIFTLGGRGRIGIGRVNADGTLDASFNPGTDTDSVVLSLAVQADGKILVGGQLFMLAGESRIGIGRLNGDGTLDTNFDPGT